MAGGLGPAPQHGDHRRQSDAAHALRLFPRSGTFPACNKRNPGSGCSAIGGVNRGHAVLGVSDACIATYPGDLAVALVAFDAVVHLGERQIAVEDFFLLPGDRPTGNTPIEPGELITAITIPASPAARRSTYLKVRDRQSYEFAAASAAVGLELEPDGRTIRDIRVGLGGVATKPWRAQSRGSSASRQALERRPCDVPAFWPWRAPSITAPIATRSIWPRASSRAPF